MNFTMPPTKADDWTDPGDLDQGLTARKKTLFAKAYPWIVRQLGRKVPHKAIRAKLSEQGLTLSPASFVSYCDEEAKVYAERGEHLCCTHCGSRFPMTATEDSSSEVAPEDASGDA